jgi:hypothetical protein
MSNDMILQYFRFGDNGIDGEDISDVIVGQPYITSAQFIPNTIPFNSSGDLVSNDCNFLITFSTNIFGLSLDKFNNINCTLSSLSGSSGQSTYNFIVIPSSRPCTFSISLDANKVIDSNGIGNIASEIYSKYAPAAPTCTITDNVSGNVNIGGSVTFTFTWSESVTGFGSADISVTGGTKGTFSGSGSSYYLTVTQSGSSDSITISFGASVCTSTTTGMSNASGASYSQGVNQYIIVYTKNINPHNDRNIGTYDNFRGGNVNGHSTTTGIRLMCAYAGSKVSPNGPTDMNYYTSYSSNVIENIDYKCATEGLAYSAHNAEWQAQRPDRIISDEYGNTYIIYGDYRGEGYCVEHGVEWIKCKLV